MIQADTVFEDDTLILSKTAYGGPPTGRSLLSFTGVGHEMNGIDVQRPEFFRAGSGYDFVYFIIDRKRTWGNALDFDRISDLIRQDGPDQTYHALGNSLGGFLALLAPSVLAVPVTQSVAFVPQFSMHPDIVPWEDRYVKYQKHITDWPIPSLDGRFVDTCHYSIITSGLGNDVKHADLFPQLSNISVFKLRRFAHNVARDLKRRGMLDECVSLGLSGRLTENWAEDAMQKPVLS